MSGFGVTRGFRAVALLGTTALAWAACGGDETLKPPSGSAATSSGTSMSSVGGGGSGGDAVGGNEAVGGAGTGAGGTGSGTCGNGAAEPGELCDGDDLRGLSCASVGFETGALGCGDRCTLDTSGCSGVERCQDARDNDGDGVYDCNDPDCASACANSCASPPALPDPAIVSGSTTGHASTPSFCTDSAGGPGVAYLFTAATTGFVDIAVTSRPGADLAVSVRSACAALATELGCSNATTDVSQSELLSLPITAGDMVYILISGNEAGDEGDFDLSVRSRVTACGDGIQDPTEECDVLIQEPNDGCSDDCRLVPTEIEPNATRATANPYAAPFYAAISPAGDEDLIRVSVPTGPTALIAETVEVTSAACTSNLLDSAIDVLDSSGGTLVSENNGGAGLCARAVAPALAAGTYYVRVKAGLGAELPTFPYRLEVTLVSEVCGDGNTTPGEQCDDGNTTAGDGCSAACRFELTEAEPNGTSGQAGIYAAPWLAEIAPAGDVDLVAVSVPGPASTLSVAISDNGTGACMAGMLDSQLDILDPDGTTLLAHDDDGGLGYCSFASANDLAAGTYFLRVRAADVAPGATFFYRLNVTLGP